MAGSGRGVTSKSKSSANPRGFKDFIKVHSFFPCWSFVFLLPFLHFFPPIVYNLCTGMKDYAGHLEYQGKNSTFYKSFIRIDGSFGFCLHTLHIPWCSSRLLSFFLSFAFFSFLSFFSMKAKLKYITQFNKIV